MSHVVEPSVRKEMFAGSEVDVLSHPAYAQVSISHVQGRTFLYGSDFEHQNYVTLKIKSSEFRRNLSRDWHFEREYIAEIAMSEAQFATMISAPNRTGVPCTLLRKGNEDIPGVPHRDSKKLYDVEIERKLRKTVQALEMQRDKIMAGVVKLPKKVQEQILEPIETAIREIASNTPFIMESFDEHMEQSVEKAKVEVNAYATNTIMRAGLASLSGEAPILAIIDGKSE